MPGFWVVGGFLGDRGGLLWKDHRRQPYLLLLVFRAMTGTTCKLFTTYVSCIPKVLQDTGAVPRYIYEHVLFTLLLHIV